MNVKRLAIFAFLPVILFLLWSFPTFAKQKVQVAEHGECALDDNYKKTIAKEGLEEAAKAYMRLQNIAAMIANIYENENGACHYLEGTSGKWWDEFFRGQLSYEIEVIRGAKWVDDNTNYSVKTTQNGNKKASWFVAQVNGNLKKYTDWDISELKKRAKNSNSKIAEISEWMKKAQPGNYIKVGGDTGDSICSAVGGCSKTTWGHNDCDIIVKLENGSFACVDTGAGSRVIAGGSSVGNGQCRMANRSIAPCTINVKAVTSSDTAYTFSSAEDFENKVTNKDSKVSACIQALDKMQALRGNKTQPDSFIGHYNKARKLLAILGGADVMCYCKKNEQGELTDQLEHCIAKDVTDEDNIEKDCYDISEYQAQMGQICLTCSLMAKILGAVQGISKNTFEVLAGDLVKLLTIAYLIYVAYLVLLTVASPETQKLSKFLQSLLTQGARVAFAALILTYPEALYSKIINPLLEGGVDFGLAFSNVKSDGSGGAMDNTIAQKIKEAGAEYASDFDGTSKYLSADTLEKLVGANKNFSKEAAMMPAIGRSFICNAVHNLGAQRLWFIPRISMLITGIILLVFGVMIWLAIGFFILDCCLQLGIVAAMMSFFVACWPFKMTSAYVKVGWNMFLNTVFNFIMLSVVIVTINVLTIQALQNMGADLTTDINENNVDAINDKLEIIGLGIVVLVVTCLICLKLSSESGRLANKFAGGAQIKMGGDLGGMAGDMATKAVKSGAKTGGKAIGGMANFAAESSGLKGAASAGKQALKEKLGGGTKSQSASFKQNQQGNDKGADKGNKNGSNSGGKEDKEGNK